MRFRWYKLTADATDADWIRALAGRNPAPLVVIGGSSSDRAFDLARALDGQRDWNGDRPLLFITTATADFLDVDPVDPTTAPAPGKEPRLIDVYDDRTFRFCFTNRQMAEAVIDFVRTDPMLRPGLVTLPEIEVAAMAAAGPWPMLGRLGMTRADQPPPLGFVLEWQDDPYSKDLSNQFREAFSTGYNRHSGRMEVQTLTPEARPVLQSFRIDFSVGTYFRPNESEARVARRILADLPARGDRGLIFVPTVPQPARRVLRTLAEAGARVGRRLVAVNGDGISVNTIYRDAAFAWPVRAIPIPLVMFAHDDPFAWDTPGSPIPPQGYELTPPNSTDDVLHFAKLGQLLAEAVFPAPGSMPGAEVPEGITARAEQVGRRLLARSPAFFDKDGNRLGGTGEFVVVLRPDFDPAGPGLARPDATIDVYRRLPTRAWERAHSLVVGADRAAEARAPAMTLNPGSLTGPQMPIRQYIGRLAPVLILWAIPVIWLAFLLATQANRGMEADRADIREWLDEARNFRRTLPELVREYVAILEETPGPDDRQTHLARRKIKADELVEHMRALAEPTLVYSGQLPLFPEIFRLEVKFPGVVPPDGVPPAAVSWTSSVPEPRHDNLLRVRETEYSPLGGEDRRAVVRCEYRLHAFNKFNRDREEARSAQLLAAGVLVSASIVVAWMVARFLKRERARELQRWQAAIDAEHQERELLEAGVRQQWAERVQEELGRKLLEQELEVARAEGRAAEAERSALELKSQLYAGIGIMAGSYAHNIKNLLVRPNDLLSRCADAVGPSDDLRRMIGEVRSTLGTVTERLQQILRTVRRDPAQTEVTRLDLNDLLREADRTWTAMAREKWKLDMTFTPASAPVPVRGDSSHLMQALENLIFNARDATFEMRNHIREEARRTTTADPSARKHKLLEAAAWKGEITVRVHREDRVAVIEVRDNGIGMTEDVRANCLKTHFSTKRDNAIYEGLSAGMGLGLSFVAVVLDHHGATSEIESTPLAGTTFRITLPLADES